jgi:PAS domain S-box-containing protein
MDYTGLSQENSQGWGWVSVIHHDDRPGLLDTWRRVLAAGQPEEAEARFRRFDGAYRWYLIRMVPIRDESDALLGWYGANTDIDDLKQAQVKLRQDEKELRQMTDATQLPIIVFSAEGRLLYANRFSLTYGGLSLEDFQRDGWRERVYHPNDRSPEWPLQIPRCSSRATRVPARSSSPARFTSVQRARPARLWP